MQFIYEYTQKKTIDLKINVNYLQKRIYFILFISIILISFELLAQNPISKEKILISEPDSKITNADIVKGKVKNQILVKVLKYNNNRYTLFDNEYIKSVLELKARQQLIGCTDTECGVQLEKILQPDFKISSTISSADKKINVSLKLFKFSGDSPSIVSVIDKSFEDYQLDFYIEEMVQFLITPNYRIRDENAPQKIVVLNELPSLKIKETNIVSNPSSSSTTNSEKVNNYINDYNNLLKEGDKLYGEGKYWDAYKIYSSIIRTIKNDLTKETQTQLRDYEKLIFEKMDISFYNSYAVDLKKIDTIFIEKLNKQPLSSEENLNIYLKYDGLYQHLLLSKKTHPGEVKEVEELIDGRMDGVLINKWSMEEKQGDDSFVSYNFSLSYKIYDKILQDNLKIKRKEGINRKKFIERVESKKLNTLKTGINYSKNKVISYTEIMERKNSIYLSYFRSSIPNDPQAIEANALVKKISQDLEAFIMSADQEFFLVNESISINDKVAKEINESRYSINDPFRVLVIGNQDLFKKLILSERRKKEIKELEKTVSVNKSTNIQKNPTPPNESNLSYYIIHTLLFPFKYIVNVFKSVTDIVSITPIAGLGGGTEILFFYIGSGVGFAPEDFTLTSVVPFEKDSVPGAPGEFIGDFGFLGINTCENYFFIRGLGKCRADKLQQYTTLNFYFSFGVGAHVTFDLGRVLDIIPVLLFMDTESIIYSRKFKAERIEYFPR
jgi:hypothetical protein